MKKGDLMLVRNKNGVFYCSKSIRYCLMFLGLKIYGATLTTYQVNFYNIDGLSTELDSNIDCCYGKYSVMCDDVSTYNTVQFEY